MRHLVAPVQKASRQLKLFPSSYGLIIPSIAAFLICFISSFIASSLIIQPQPSKAVTGLGLVNPASITMTSNANSLELTPTPGINDGLAAVSHTLTTNTNVPTGYSLTLATPATPTLATTSSTRTSPAPLTSNTWGYALANVGNFDSDYTTPTPSITSKWANPSEGATIKNTNTAATNDTTTIYYGAKVDQSLASGIYANAVKYTAIANAVPAPTIISIEPDGGSLIAGMSIIIVGTGFTVNDQSITTSITIGGVNCTGVTIASNKPATGQDTLACMGGAHAEGVVDVAITTLGGTATLINGYTYVQQPTVTFISPNQASTIAGTESGPAFTIIGTGFTGAIRVNIGDGPTASCQSFEVISDTHILCKAPKNMHTTVGSKTVFVAKPAGNTGMSANFNGASVTYTDTDYPTLQSSNAYTNCTTTAKLFRDTRDSQLYYAKKMPDNKCWMVDNLKYANYGNLSQEAGKYLTVDGTSAQSTANSDIAKYVDPGATDYCKGNTNLPTNTNARCGLLYNWYAATSGSGTYAQSVAGTNVTGDICPANFRLPSGASDGSTATGNGTSYNAADLPVLNASMNVGSLATGSTTSHPASWQPSGTWSGTFAGTRGNDFGMESHGYYWSSTVNSAANTRILNFNSSIVNPGDSSNNKYNGLAVRCVMDNPVTNFSYTGTVQTFTAPNNGTYQVELWGASGGNATDLHHYQNTNLYGGAGGHTKGTIYLEKGVSLYVHVGEAGKTMSSVWNGGKNGGWYNHNTGGYAGSGGGATDVRLVRASQTDNTVWNELNSLRSRIIVASGGGGASGLWTNVLVGLTAGAGGGIIGGRTINSTKLNGFGGTQVSGGATGDYPSHPDATSGVFGEGGTGSAYAGGGGGGGYYGGGGGDHQTPDITGHGGGGSSYISGHTGAVAITSASNQAPKAGCTTGTADNTCSIHYSGKTFTSTLMIDGTGYNWTNAKGALQAMPNPAGGLYSSGVGHTGNGYARITYLGA